MLAIEDLTDGQTVLFIPNKAVNQSNALNHLDVMRDWLKERAKTPTTASIIYHFKLLIESHLISGSVQYPHTQHSHEANKNNDVPTGVHIYGLSWEGHEFLDNTRSPKVWNALMTGVKDVSYNVMNAVAAQLSINGATKLVSKLTS